MSERDGDKKWFDSSRERDQLNHVLAGGGGLVAAITLGVLVVVAIVLGVMA